MSATMASKDTTARLVIQVKVENRDALKMESLLRGLDMGEIVDELIEANLTDMLEKIRDRRNPPPDPGPKPRKS